MKLIVSWITNALIILVVNRMMTGFVVDSFVTALAIVLLLGVLNFFLKPVLIFFTLPINLFTLGLFTFIINGFILWLAANFIVGFEIHSFSTAILASILISLFNWILQMFT